VDSYANDSVKEGKVIPKLTVILNLNQMSKEGIETLGRDIEFVYFTYIINSILILMLGNICNVSPSH